MMKGEEKLLRISATTIPGSLASSISHRHEEDELCKLTLRAIGAGAVNQAVKGVAVANKHLAKRGFYACITPSFKRIEGDRTAMEFRISFQKFG
jgi:stage V sporulation protein SpoVS